MALKMITVDGKQYVNARVFADGCGCKGQKIAAACKAGRVVGAFQDSKKKWFIPIDASKPLELEEIRKLMIMSLYLKNRPELSLDYSEKDKIEKLYTYLEKTGYIEPFDHNSDRIPYEVVLTEKGMKSATEGSSICVDWIHVGTTIIQVCASVITIVQVII